MKQYAQTLDEILDSLSEITSDWKDDHAEETLEALKVFKEFESPTRERYIRSLTQSFSATITVIRLILELSKDEFGMIFKSHDANQRSPSKTYFARDTPNFILTLEKMGLFKVNAAFFRTTYSWKDLVTDRLKTGRGSAIRGQKRGRALEDWVEQAIIEVFGGQFFERNISFSGKITGNTAKADFAIPNKENPKIVIEAKAYGATGSKQSDVLGDVKTIVTEKRHDTYFMLVTDGITWHLRTSDLKKIVELQNRGDIYRVYTTQMREELLSDLLAFKKALF